MDFHAYQMNTAHGGMDLDLASPPDEDELANVDVSELTTSVHQGWRPPGFLGSVAVRPDIELPTQSRHTGAFSDPLPDVQNIVELSSDEASIQDSAYVTARHGNTGTQYSVDAIDFQELASDRGIIQEQTEVPTQQRNGRPRAGKVASDSLIQQSSGRKGRRKVTQLPRCTICGYEPTNASNAR